MKLSVKNVMARVLPNAVIAAGTAKMRTGLWNALVSIALAVQLAPNAAAQEKRSKHQVLNNTQEFVLALFVGQELNLGPLFYVIKTPPQHPKLLGERRRSAKLLGGYW